MRDIVGMDGTGNPGVPQLVTFRCGTRWATRAGLGVVSLSLLMGCGFSPPRVANQPVRETVFAVQTLVLQPGDIANYLRINGEVRSSASVDVFPEVAGRISRMLVSRGQNVSQGQILLYVDPSRPGAEFLDSPVTAPISGTIVALPFSAGAFVGPQVSVARITRNRDLELVTAVAERHATVVRIGQPATVRLEAFPGREFRARVSFVAPFIDPLSRTLEVRLAFESLDPQLRPGMFADIQIVTEVRRGVLRAPSDAVLDRFGETFVFVAREDGTAEKRLVRRGIEIDNVTELVEGVRAGERLIIRGQTLLEDGSKIRVIDG